MPAQDLEVADWWNQELKNLSKQTRRTKAAFLMYTAWNRKERNRRIFEDRRMNPMQVEQEIKMEMMIRERACGRPELS
ncbi:hypothetical protein BAE44_0014791 [Dichanthelium oligosanthes]|uniref:Uncharacterized protein n=1 Tax=Dichanthelium oligosanthes TaxID=888268 RepID=A0A1E5VGF5_9POAL|nr:hypothetical protein BAE44_0014791 [Dichanthelium oligosanthes]